MEILGRSQVIGNQIGINTTDSRHINGKATPQKNDDPVKPFADVLLNTIQHTNRLQMESSEMEQKLILAPEEVNIHEVMIASEKARLSISLLKTITEKAIKAYNDIMMIR